MATKAVKKSPLLGGKQKIDNKMALAIIAAVLGVCAVIYYLASHAAALAYNTNLSNSGQATVYACRTAKKINLEVVNYGQSNKLTYWFDSNAQNTLPITSNAEGTQSTTSYASVDIKGSTFAAWVFAEGTGADGAAETKVTDINKCSEPVNQAQLGLSAYGLPTGTAVTFKADRAVGKCGTSIKVKPSKVCKSPQDIASAESPITVTYPMSVKAAGKTYVAYKLCGGMSDRDGGRGGCDDENLTGTTTVYAKAGPNGVTTWLGVEYTTTPTTPTGITYKYDTGDQIVYWNLPSDYSTIQVYHFFKNDTTEVGTFTTDGGQVSSFGFPSMPFVSGDKITMQAENFQGKRSTISAPVYVP